MKKVLSVIALAALFLTSHAFAADPVIGTWKLNVAKSKFNTGAVLTAGTRVYTEANGLYTLDQKLTGTVPQRQGGKAGHGRFGGYHAREEDRCQHLGL